MEILEEIGILAEIVTAIGTIVLIWLAWPVVKHYRLKIDPSETKTKFDMDSTPNHKDKNGNIIDDKRAKSWWQFWK